jgi:hypothetical protein
MGGGHHLGGHVALSQRRGNDHRVCQSQFYTLPLVNGQGFFSPDGALKQSATGILLI